MRQYIDKNMETHQLTQNLQFAMELYHYITKRRCPFEHNQLDEFIS